MSLIARQRLLIAIALAAVVAMLFAPSIPQDPAYHLFAGGDRLFTIPNAGNVLSNLLFAWAGTRGIFLALRRGELLLGDIYPAYITFFVSLLLIAAGSAWYHWAPDNVSLAFDRLAMALAFSSFFSILLAERVSARIARRLFPLLLLAGAASIAYWLHGELAGRGDLRAYALVQFLPVILTPVILLAFPSRYSRAADLWWLLAWYLAAKLCEILDHQLYAWLGFVSGHSLKHIAAGIGCLVFLRHLRLRRALPG
jgi:hypothetical protein